MRRARLRRPAHALALIAVLSGATGGTLLACSDDAATTSGMSGDAGGRTDAGGDVSAPPVPANGIVVVHGATFPAFRLCFANYPELRPQPTATLMPNANVVGVEVGSAVRLDPMTRPPGKVYVVVQRKVAASLNADGSTDLPCGKRVCPLGEQREGCLRVDSDYVELPEPIATPLGVDAVDVLAITGCGNSAFQPDGFCGDDFDPARGNLRAQRITLSSDPLSPAPNQAAGLGVQLVHLAPRLEWQRADAGGDLSVAYGALSPPPDGGADASLDAPLAVTFAKNPPLFAPSPEERVDLTGATEAIFATHGFRLAVSNAAQSETLVLTQSLASVQDLSAPLETPTAYYRAVSNFALLLVGDPAVASDAGPAAARRAVHLLAVPIRAERDAGGDAATTEDAAAEQSSGGFR